MVQVVSVFKERDASDVTNFRPVTVSSSLTKIVESGLSYIIYNYVRDKISQWQHAFIPGRSTVTNILSLLQYFYPIVSAEGQVDVIDTELSKTFKTVNFLILFNKVIALEVLLWVVGILSSYLFHRMCVVDVEGTYSKVFTPTSSVPQGSNLGPLLFILYANYFVPGLLCIFLMYADDVKLFMACKSVQDCQSLQAPLDIIVNHCQVNKLLINE